MMEKQQQQQYGTYIQWIPFIDWRVRVSDLKNIQIKNKYNLLSLRHTTLEMDWNGSELDTYTLTRVERGGKKTLNKKQISC